MMIIPDPQTEEKMMIIPDHQPGDPLSISTESEVQNNLQQQGQQH